MTIAAPSDLAAKLATILDLVPLAIFIIDGDGRLLHRNRYAESATALVDGLAGDARLEAALTSRDAPTMLQFPTQENLRPVDACVLPLEGNASAVILDDASRSVRGHVLRLLYGLTPMEARVAVSLVRGADVAECATDHGIAINTLRRHLKNIYAKLRVRGQCDVVRLLAPGLASLRINPSDPDG